MFLAHEYYFTMSIQKFHAKFSDGASRIPMNSAGVPFPGLKVLVDGYEVQVRALEGVFFECELDMDGMGVTVSVQPEDEAYLSRFALEPIFQGVVDFLESTDIVDDIQGTQYELHVQEWGDDWHSESCAKIACKTLSF